MKACKLITYRQRFARTAPSPRAMRFQDSKNRGRASPVKIIFAWGPQALLLKQQRSEGNVDRGRAARQDYFLGFFDAEHRNENRALFESSRGCVLLYRIVCHSTLITSVALNLQNLQIKF